VKKAVERKEGVVNYRTVPYEKDMELPQAKAKSKKGRIAPRRVSRLIVEALLTLLGLLLLLEEQEKTKENECTPHDIVDELEIVPPVVVVVVSFICSTRTISTITITSTCSTTTCCCVSQERIIATRRKKPRSSRL
jgi:hypothetical protein